MALFAFRSSLLATALVAGGCQDPLDFGQPRSCQVADQNDWVHDVMTHAYLWAVEMPEVDPREFASPATLVAAVRHEQDRWSRVADRDKSKALFDQGMYVGLGLRTRRDEAGVVRVASIHRGSPADAAGLRRGDSLRAINSLSIQKIDDDGLWGQVYGENLPGVTVQLEVEAEDGTIRELFLVKDWVEIDTVPQTEIVSVDGVDVGYIRFETFVQPAFDDLDAAFSTLREAGVRHLVLDLRYNGGGLLSVATHLASLVGGGVKSGRVFYRARYNDALSDQNWTRHLSRKEGSLDLERVVFITTGSTLSASELVINGLRPHVSVRLVGGRTGGKPVGTRFFDFCDKVLFPITFRLENDEGVGDYFDGLAPDCPAADDFAAPLGDPTEHALEMALLMALGDACPRQSLGGAVPQDHPIRTDGLSEVLGDAW